MMNRFSFFSRAPIGLLITLVVCINPVRFAYGVPIIFFGEDLGTSSGNQVPRLPSFPSATAAQGEFLSSLTDVRVEDFESITPGSVAPVDIDFGAGGNATIMGSGFVNNLPTSTFLGVYPTSGDQYWSFTQGTSAFSVDFDLPQAAFGFFGTDIGDVGAQLTLTLQTTGSDITQLTVPHTIFGPSGSALFFGVIDVENPFSGLTFGSTVPTIVDGFGFDDFTIATASQVSPTPEPPTEGTPIPEPPTIVLVSIGLLAVAVCKYKKLDLQTY